MGGENNYSRKEVPLPQTKSDQRSGGNDRRESLYTKCYIRPAKLTGVSKARIGFLHDLDRFMG